MSRQLRVPSDFERRVRRLCQKLNDKYPRQRITMVDIVANINMSDKEIEMRIISNKQKRRNRYVY